MEGTINLQNREFHPVASIFPMMGQDEYSDLKSDIEQNGLLESIWLDQEGLIVDGRKRRHLTQSQKACVALEIEVQLAIEARERQRIAGLTFGRGQGEKVVTILSLAIGKSRDKAAMTMGTSPSYVSDAKKIKNDDPQVFESIASGKINIPDAKKIAKLEEPQRKEVLGKIDSGLNPADAIRETVREAIRTELEAVDTIAVKAIQGVYDVVVIDPPWPMVKIERDVTPTQVLFDYPTMTLEEITEMKIPCADDCHVWLWTTQKFLADSIDIVNAWGLEFAYTFVWHKPGGFQPYGQAQFNCEFALYCRKGSPKFLDTKDLPTCFSAPRTGHSQKPQAFYDMVRRVTSGRRLDMFNRRRIDGFDRWGKESK